MQETKSLVKAERLNKKFGKEDFHYDMEEVSSEPGCVNKKLNQITEQQLFEKQKQALHGSSQTTTQAIENQTKATQESSIAWNKNSQKSIEQGLQEYDEITTAIINILPILLRLTKYTPILLRQFPTS